MSKNKKEYTAEETAAFKAARKKPAKSLFAKLIELTYPKNATLRQAGQTAVGSSALHFPLYQRASIKPKWSDALYNLLQVRNNSKGSAKRSQIIELKNGKTRRILHKPIPQDEKRPAFNQFNKFKNR